MPIYSNNSLRICSDESFSCGLESTTKQFTRCRRFTLPRALSFVLSSVHAAVQSELDQFFATLRNRAQSVRQVTAQAFYQAQYEISALVFDEVQSAPDGAGGRRLADPVLESLARGRGGW